MEKRSLCGVSGVAFQSEEAIRCTEDSETGADARESWGNCGWFHKAIVGSSLLNPLSLRTSSLQSTSSGPLDFKTLDSPFSPEGHKRWWSCRNWWVLSFGLLVLG